MSHCGLGILSCLWAVLLGPVDPAVGECAALHTSLNSSTAVQDSGGVITGPLTFTAAVNGDGADFGGSSFVTWNSSLFNAPRGAISFWFRKNSSDTEGGILQIGLLGQPNSLGVFYVGQDTIVFELRNAASDVAAISESAILSQSDWHHIVVSWNDRGDGMDMWLFLDGHHTTYEFLPGSFVHSAEWMQLGTTGYYGLAEGGVDELRVFDANINDDEVYAEYLFSSNRHRWATTVKPISTGPVQVVGKALFVNGEPFKVRGVGYQPVPIGEPISSGILEYIYTDPGILARDMSLLRAMNVNTIRLWSQAPDTTLLDACYNGGVDPIYVVMGFWVPLHAGIDYADPATIASIKNDFRACVSAFKDHPAMLAWGIGNENNLAYEGDLADWYALANELAEEAWIEEGATYHPAVVINGGLRDFGNVDLGSDDESLSFVDIWGHNAYPGWDFHCYFDYFDRISSKALLLTEFGIDAWDNAAGAEYESVQADYVVQQWRQLVASSIGGTLMAYSDEWWKAGDPSAHDLGGYGTAAHPDGYSNEEWWGVMRAIEDGAGPDVMQPRQVYSDLGFEYSIGLGDLNCDGMVDGLDIRAFVFAVTAPGSHAATYPTCSRIWADCSGDSLVDDQDIWCFVARLLSP